MPKGGESPKGPTWKSPKSPEEIERLNKEAATERALTDLEKQNRDALAEIDRELIAVTRKKAEAILAATAEIDREQAEKLLDAMERNTHPKDMISAIHGETEEERQIYPIWYAAMASAFLALTKDY